MSRSSIRNSRENEEGVADLETDESSIYQGKSLFRRGNYTLLRLLVTLESVGEKGIPTRKLLDEIGTHAIQDLLDKAEKDLELIERTPGGRTELSGRFEPKICRLTEKGRQLLKSQLRPSP
jgi:hypothetical protein